MNWQQVCEDPSLQDLPYKIELNEYGQVVMSPASNQHGRQQARLAILLTQHGPEGEVISECSIDTPKGVKVADVVWASPPFIKQCGSAMPSAPFPFTNRKAPFRHRISSGDFLHPFKLRQQIIPFGWGGVPE